MTLHFASGGILNFGRFFGLRVLRQPKYDPAHKELLTLYRDDIFRWVAVDDEEVPPNATFWLNRDQAQELIDLLQAFILVATPTEESM